MDAEKIWEAATDLAGSMFVLSVKLGAFMEQIKPLVEPEIFEWHYKFFEDCFGVADERGSKLLSLVEKLPSKEIKVDENTTITDEPFRSFTAAMHTPN